MKNPKSQVISKEELAKYINTYSEEYDGKRLVIGPHWVVKGNQKNYAQFIGFNLEKKVDNIYFEDAVSKAIIFRTAEKLYGVKPNAIGDMRYITVPYTIAYIGYHTAYKLDLYKIWKQQALSNAFKDLLFNLMKEIEAYIKDNAPSALYGEWAKKEDCWNEVKEQNLNIDFSSIKRDLEDSNNPSKRKRISDKEASQIQIDEDLLKLISIPPEIWHRIEDWGRITGKLTEQQKTIAYTLAGRVRNNTNISDYERVHGVKLLELVSSTIPELLEGVDEINDVAEAKRNNESEITIDLVKRMVDWDRSKRKLKDSYYRTLLNIANGTVPFGIQAKKNVKANLEILRKYGFR